MLSLQNGEEDDVSECDEPEPEPERKRRRTNHNRTSLLPKSVYVVSNERRNPRFVCQRHANGGYSFYLTSDEGRLVTPLHLWYPNEVAPMFGHGGRPCKMECISVVKHTKDVDGVHVRVLWRNGCVTSERLDMFGKHAPWAIFLYATRKNLLETDGWTHLSCRDNDFYQTGRGVVLDDGERRAMEVVRHLRPR